MNEYKESLFSLHKSHLTFLFSNLINEEFFNPFPLTVDQQFYSNILLPIVGF